MAILLYQGNNGQKQAEGGPFSTIDSLISRMYQVISIESAESRNWDVFRKLFRSEARINALGKDQRGEERFISLTVEDYIRGAEASFQKQRLNEQEIGRVVEEYGDMVHVFSSYETKDATNERILQRGINSIQLIYREERYWIVSLLFNPETKDNPITERHLFPKEIAKPVKTRKPIYQK
ncbi:MAG: hypothetical protein ACOYN9_12860 [Saprospiraceae bacterium]|jgi:hypothetical protein